MSHEKETNTQINYSFVHLNVKHFTWNAYNVQLSLKQHIHIHIRLNNILIISSFILLSLNICFHYYEHFHLLKGRHMGVLERQRKTGRKERKGRPHYGDAEREREREIRREDTDMPTIIHKMGKRGIALLIWISSLFIFSSKCDWYYYYYYHYNIIIIIILSSFTCQITVTQLIILFSNYCTISTDIFLIMY